MKNIELSFNYRLYAFLGYWPMHEVRDKMRNVVIKEFKDMKEIESNHYVLRQGDYVDFHESRPSKVQEISNFKRNKKYASLNRRSPRPSKIIRTAEAHRSFA